MRSAGRFATALGAIACACALALVGAATAQAQEPPVQVLLFHGPSDARTDAGVAAIEALGAANDFGVEATDDATAFTSDNLDELPRRRLPQHRRRPPHDARRRRRSRPTSRTAAASSASASAAAGRAGQQLLQRADRRPADRVTARRATTPQIVAVGDRVHPVHARTSRSSGTAPTSGTSGKPGPTGKCTPSPATARRTLPAGDGTNVGGTDHPISWCRDYEGGRSFYTGMGRTAASYARGGLPRAPARRDPVDRRPAARQLQGHDQRQLRVDPADRSGPDRRPAWPRAASRTASSSPPTAGSSTSAAATAGPTPSAARCSSPARSGASSTTRTRTSASAAAASTSGTRRSTTGTVNSGVTRAGVLAVYGDGGQGGERTNEPNHKIEYGLLGITPVPGLHADRPHLPAVLPELQPDQHAARPAAGAADLEDVAGRGSRASR